MSKLTLMNFSHRSAGAVSLTLQIANTTIEPSMNVIYLGTILYQLLGWKEQEANAIKNGTAWATQIRRAVRPDIGLTPKNARCLTTSVVLPRILYGTDIWAMPTHRNEDSKAEVISKISSKFSFAQRAGAQPMVGGFRTSPTDPICARSDVLPAQLELYKHRGNAALRLATLPGQYPLSNIFRKYGKRTAKRQKSPMYHLANTYKVDPDAYKTILTAERNTALSGKQPFKTIRDLSVSPLCSVSGLVSHCEGKGPARR